VGPAAAVVVVEPDAREKGSPTLIVGNDAEKELSRARKVMGAAWVAEPLLSYRR